MRPFRACLTSFPEPPEDGGSTPVSADGHEGITAMAVSFSEALSLLTPPAPTPVGYSVDDVERLFFVTYTPEQRAALQAIPFSEDVLKACVGTHMLFPGFGLSLLDIRDKNAALFYRKTGGWYAEEKHVFSRQRVPLRWYLLRTTPVPDSFRKTWKEQQALLLPDEEVPAAALIAFATMLHFRAAGKRLFESCWVRTSDVDSVGGRVSVGYFDAVGFNVDYGWGDGRSDGLGLSASRKF